MRIQNYAIPADAMNSPVLVNQLQTKLGVVPCGFVGTNTSSMQVQVQVPDDVTDAQINAAISAWSPNDAIPAPPTTPAIEALGRIRQAIQQNAAWSSISQKQKDGMLRDLISYVLNTTVE